jgi:hypothetical protein
MSGYTADVILQRGVDSVAGFLEKPFTPVALTVKVREILAGRASWQATA